MSYIAFALIGISFGAALAGDGEISIASGVLAVVLWVSLSYGETK